MALWKPTVRRYWRREPGKNAKGHPDLTALRISIPFNHFKDHLGRTVKTFQDSTMRSILEILDCLPSTFVD